MRVPFTLPVLGVEYAIDYVPVEDLKEDCADHNSDELEIRIRQDMAGQWRRWIAHEFAHAVLSVCGITETLSEEQEEEICRAFEHALPQTYELREDVIFWDEIDED